MGDMSRPFFNFFCSPPEVHGLCCGGKLQGALVLSTLTFAPRTRNEKC